MQPGGGHATVMWKIIRIPDGVDGTMLMADMGLKQNGLVHVMFLVRWLTVKVRHIH